MQCAKYSHIEYNSGLIYHGTYHTRLNILKGHLPHYGNSSHEQGSDQGMIRYLPQVRLLLAGISPGSRGAAQEEEVNVGSRAELPPLHPRPCPSNARREQNRLCPSSLSLAGLQGLHKPDRTVSSTLNFLSPFLSTIPWPFGPRSILGADFPGI